MNEDRMWDDKKESSCFKCRLIYHKQSLSFSKHDIEKSCIYSKRLKREYNSLFASIKQFDQNSTKHSDWKKSTHRYSIFWCLCAFIRRREAFWERETHCEKSRRLSFSFRTRIYEIDQFSRSHWYKIYSRFQFSYQIVIVSRITNAMTTYTNMNNSVIWDAIFSRFELKNITFNVRRNRSWKSL